MRRGGGGATTVYSCTGSPHRPCPQQNMFSSPADGHYLCLPCSSTLQRRVFLSALWKDRLLPTTCFGTCVCVCVCSYESDWDREKEGKKWVGRLLERVNVATDNRLSGRLLPLSSRCCCARSAPLERALQQITHNSRLLNGGAHATVKPSATLLIY